MWLLRSVLPSDLYWPSSERMQRDPSYQELVIQGVTSSGQTFRPSDWADRLAGVMSQFRPGGVQPEGRFGYSPWCVPTVIDGIKCVVVHADLQQAEPMAWDFVLGFAKDNDLKLVWGAGRS